MTNGPAKEKMPVGCLHAEGAPGSAYKPGNTECHNTEWYDTRYYETEYYEAAKGCVRNF